MAIKTKALIIGCQREQTVAVKAVTNITSENIFLIIKIMEIIKKIM